MVDRLYINNYKSLVDFELTNIPNFCVFAGANGTGKSNIFEALQFLAKAVSVVGSGYETKGFFIDKKNTKENFFNSTFDSFGGIENVLNKSTALNNEQLEELDLSISRNKYIPVGLKIYIVKDDSGLNTGGISHPAISIVEEPDISNEFKLREKEYSVFRGIFSRIFVGKTEVLKEINIGNRKLASDANNLSKVLDRILRDLEIKEEILNWLSLLIPEFEDIKTEKGLDGNVQFYIKEKHTDAWFSAELISDGTKAILALLTVVYQTDEPQFICIEEPENGLNPYVQRTLIEFFRDACNDLGHTIWLNTHSQTIVRELNPGELVLIEKEKGITKGNHIKSDRDLRGLTMDEAWLSNFLEGGVPW